ncbi:hypothetical protein SAMN05444581_11922 [Methylocapsa palsarum]|uniref:Uncharacterized protein n=1 Tax=Methylocapsa palsarum TaxID=1612308 RepID=A0A1I4C8H8_9HYPH|nr:hypothetical protein SAMN05444581_11922 [Methylocapsa palsarum]
MFSKRASSTWTAYANGEPWELLNSAPRRQLRGADLSDQSGACDGSRSHVAPWLLFLGSRTAGS